MPDNSKHIMIVGGEMVTVSAVAQALSQVPYRVSMVGTAGEAVRVLKSSTVDLVLCDVRQSGLSDVYASQSAQSTFTTPNAPFLFFGDERWPAARLLSADKRRGMISLPCPGGVLTGAVRSALAGPAPPSAPTESTPGGDLGEWDLSGHLDAVPVEQLLQLFENTRKTGVMRLSTDRFTGDIYLVDGAVHHAELGEVEGREAVYLLVNLRDGRFDFKLNVRPSRRSIDDNIASLLLEGLRQRDETISIVSSYKKKKDSGIYKPKKS